MEYNIDLLDGIDIYGENALTLILKQILPKSKVLEFGPAYGRMTRYLKKKLECSVSCVEINRKAKAELEKLADKVIIGNIEDYDWESELEIDKFDYIIFADILEHLIDPLKVMKRSMTYLKKYGIIFVSVPNIAHNAVIKCLLADRFMYQDYGILDRTHLRFFAKETLEELAKECGLFVCSRSATYYDDDMTEIVDQISFENDGIKKTLQQREFGQVYQFVYGLCKDEKKNIKNVEIKRKLAEENGQRLQNNDICKIYIDNGSGYSEKLTISQKYRVTNGNTLEFYFDTATFIHNLRIDPMDNRCICIIYQIVVEDAQKEEHIVEIEKISSNALYQIQNMYVFDHTDPQIMISGVCKEIKVIRITFNVLCKNIISKDYFTILKYVSQIVNQMKETESEEKRKIQNEYNNLHNEMIHFRNVADEQNKKLFEQNIKLVCLEDEKLKQSIAEFLKE